MSTARWRSLAPAVVACCLLAGCATEPAPPPLPTPSGVSACPSGQLLLEGATVSSQLVNSYSAGYAEACRNASTVVWTTAEDGGHRSFVNALVQEAVSQSWLTTEETEQAKRRCNGHPAWHIPTAANPVSIIFRLDGVQQLRLSPDTLAMIFAGQVRRWSDPRIVADNPGVPLPEQQIEVWYPNGPQGSSEALGRYLARTVPKRWSPRNTTTNWRGQGQGKDRPEDVVSAVQARSGTIGFAELAQLGSAKVSTAGLKIEGAEQSATPEATSGATPAAGPAGTPGQSASASPNPAGAGLVPTQETSTRALESAQPLPTEGVELEHDLRLDPASFGTRGGYPVQAITYQIVCSQGLPTDQTSLVRDFVTYTINPQAQTGLKALGRVPLPDALRRRTQEAVVAIR